MKTKLLIILLIVFSSCKPKTPKAEISNSDSIDSRFIENEYEETYDYGEESEVNPEDFPGTEEEMKAFLEKYVTENQLKIMMAALEKYENISTDVALAKFYLVDMDTIINAINMGMQKSHPDVRYSGDSRPAEAWEWLSDFMPYVRMTCPCSECESGAFAVIYVLQEKAKITKGKIDDTFFDALNAFFYNPEFGDALVYAGNANNWYSLDGCDFCDYCNLGNGSYLNMLKKTIATERITDLFDKYLEHLMEATTGVDYYMRFGSSKEDVLHEINEMLILKDSTQFDLSNLEKLKTRLTANDEGVQFDCKDGGCSYDY